MTCVTNGNGTGHNGQPINFHDTHANVPGDYIVHSHVGNLRDRYTPYTFQTNCSFQQQDGDNVVDATITMTITMKIGKNN
jgi:hypothetical protein